MAQQIPKQRGRPRKYNPLTSESIQEDSQPKLNPLAQQLSDQMSDVFNDDNVTKRSKKKNNFPPIFEDSY